MLNRYDALGRRVSRTLNGTETRYVLDLAGSMERILCDLDAAGSVTAWYVHGPDLAFKISADGTLTCYHADAQANIIALSGTNGTTLAQYAFTPYGRTLGSTLNTNSPQLSTQPYLFVGSQGVMEDLPGLYFMRARYYSAEAGVFFSTDPVKNIGPTWRPQMFAYSGSNPNRWIDPDGRLFGSVFSWAASVVSRAVATVVNVFNSSRSSVGTGSPSSSTPGGSGTGNGVVRQGNTSATSSGTQSPPSFAGNATPGGSSALSGTTPSVARHSAAVSARNAVNVRSTTISPESGGLAQGSQTASAGNAEFAAKIFKTALSVIPQLYKGITQGFGTAASPSPSGAIADVGPKTLDVVVSGGAVLIKNAGTFDGKIPQYLQELKDGVPLSDILAGESTNYGLDYTLAKKERLLRQAAESQGIPITE